MFIIYKSEEFRQEFIDLIKFCDDKGIRYDTYYDKDDIENVDYIVKPDGEDYIAELDEEGEIDYIFELDEECDFCFELPEDYETPTLTIREAIDIKNDVSNSKLDGHIYKGKNKFIVRVAASELWYERFMEPAEATFKYNGKNYNICLDTSSEEYAISVFINNQYSKYIPPRLDDDLFICVECEDGVDENIDAIIERYIFEVDSVFGIQLFHSPRPEFIFYDFDDEIDDGVERTRMIRDIEVDDNLTEILSIFNKASNIESIESKILNYTRVIEYASQTVIKKGLFESVLNKLSSDRIYNPDSDYILELEQIFKDNNKYSKDKEAIKVTIKQCCDAMNIKSYAPKFLKKINKLKTDSEMTKQIEALEELGEAIADTRNMFSHAKTNYTKKGMECPSEQLFEFGQCVKVAAYQVIRWYSRQSNIYLIK